ncbi:archaeal proteasome endopeptidase complex subunit alpha [Halostella litorea]|uniref:archaeal proteasome endopeptidase complex subunit alpha n=1 Tax=Halostella litorea TaxID=2528831 RepID=UPI001091CAA3|nr:archaeal proteasome endopeptidase complex subunit alpha [Halostella litorea]
MQGHDQTAYDRGVTVFSPDGRLYQVEYAREAVTRGHPTVGVRYADGVALAADGRRRSSLQVADSVEKLHAVDDHLGVATAGHVADARRLVDLARVTAQRERLRYGEPMPVEALAKSLADAVQETTQTGGARPFGVALLVAGVDRDGPALYEVDPSGTPTAWRAVAVGGDGGLLDHLEGTYEPGLDESAAVDRALDALRADADDELADGEADVAVIDGEGYRNASRDDG